MRDCKRVAIIGAGCSGLAAIKCCVDEGLEPVCFERTDSIGGLWRYTQKVTDGQGCVMKSTETNIDKEMMCYSDFLMPKEYPIFLHCSLYLKYVEDYARHFQLQQHIRHNMEVKRISPASDFQTTGRWTVQVQDHHSGHSSTEVFDAVMVCSGHHGYTFQPSFPGLADFQGQVLHSRDYRDTSGYVGKRAVVIGGGFSACDVAVDFSRSGQVYLSTTRGSWIVHRMGANGMPFDMVMNQRVNKVVGAILPPAVFSWFMKKRMSSFEEREVDCLRPTNSVMAQPASISDDLAIRIACGSVRVKPPVTRFTVTGVHFADGSFEDNIDLVVMATGYQYGFPFLDKSVVDVKENRLPFFKFMFHPDLQHPTLAIVGGVDPLGGLPTVAEMQSRLATRVFKGDVTLPSSSQMWEDIRAREKAIAQRFVKSQRHACMVDYVPFMDELAELNGCKPDFVSLLKTDPKLALRVMFGPCTPSQYRLMGPGQWKGARDAILTTMDRVRYPLSTRPLPPSAGQHHFLLWLLALGLLVCVMAWVCL